jgi:hypothetical protein
MVAPTPQQVDKRNETRICSRRFMQPNDAQLLSGGLFRRVAGLRSNFRSAGRTLSGFISYLVLHRTSNIAVDARCVTCSPQPLRFCLRIDSANLPPEFFLASVVEGPMMHEAERNCPLVAHFASQSPRLRETQMMRVAWDSRANKTRERGNIAQVIRVSNSLRSRQAKR